MKLNKLWLAVEGKLKDRKVDSRIVFLQMDSYSSIIGMKASNNKLDLRAVEKLLESESAGCDIAKIARHWNEMPALNWA